MPDTLAQLVAHSLLIELDSRTSEFAGANLQIHCLVLSRQAMYTRVCSVRVDSSCWL